MRPIKRTLTIGPRDKVTIRNAPCPCGSGKKMKHCCQTPEGLESLRLLNWLKRNDKKPPEGVVYNDITREELLDPKTLLILLDRAREVDAELAAEREKNKGKPLLAPVIAAAIGNVL